MQRVPPPYIALPFGLLRLETLRPPAKLVWGLLRQREGPGWTRLPSLARLAAGCGLKWRAVGRALRTLAAHDPPLVALKSGPGGPCYRTVGVAPPARPGRPSGAAPADAPRDPPGTAGAASGVAPTDKSENVIQRTEEPPPSLPPGCAAGLTDGQKRILRIAFPHGCTPNQFMCLMQAVTAAARLGLPDCFIGNALLADSAETAPWKRIEEQVARVRTDAARCAEYWNRAIEAPGVYRRFLWARREDAAVKEWARASEPLRARCNWLFEWPKEEAPP